jgi:hypothetical protein
MGCYKLTREKQSTSQDWQLFNLETDIGETANLRSAKPELAEHLIVEYERWEKDAKIGHRALRSLALGRIVPRRYNHNQMRVREFHIFE